MSGMGRNGYQGFCRDGNNAGFYGINLTSICGAEMIIKAPKNTPTGLYDAKGSGDKIIFDHIQNIQPVLERAADIRKNSDNGWSEKRSFRHIACIPTVEYFNHPEWEQDKQALVKWLKTEYGSAFRTVSGGLG